ncbi:outer membrane lipoprotein carrier protein LolA [Altererythrobacter sp. GH1-8]|uniref:LolA family protein n=1 Tax=Altererythrobacter sp. GH1-8 TaxID=3349333 RepID=UPI00374CADD5
MIKLPDIRHAALAAAAGVLAFALPAAATLSTPAYAQANSSTEKAQLDRAVTALRAISTMKADFTQTDRMGNSVAGQLTLKRPGKIRFQYQDDAQMLVVSNGRSLYLVDYEVDQVQRWPIRRSPLGALLDPDRDVSKYGKLVPTNNPDVVSIEVRDPSRPEFGTITMIFVRSATAPGGLQLTNWVALDAQNYRTTVRLRNHRYGVAVSDDAFTFRDPRQSSRRPR